MTKALQRLVDNVQRRLGRGAPYVATRRGTGLFTSSKYIAEYFNERGVQMPQYDSWADTAEEAARATWAKVKGDEERKRDVKVWFGEDVESQ